MLRLACSGCIRPAGGRITGNSVTLTALTDLNNLGGKIDATRAITLTAERDINIASTTSTDTNAQGTRTRIDRVAGVYITGENGTLTVNAKRDIKVTAADIFNGVAESGSANTGPSTATTRFTAGNDVIFGILNETLQQTYSDGQLTHSENQQTARVSQVHTQGHLVIDASNDITAEGTQFSASGDASLTAERDINLTAVANRDLRDTSGKNARTINDTTTFTQATVVSGGNASMDAGQDINMIGSTLTAAGDASLHAERDTNLIAVNNSDYHYDYRKKDQALGRNSTTRNETLHTTNVGSAVTAGGKLTVNTALGEDGSVTLKESRNVLLHGSTLQGGGDVIAGAGENMVVTANTEAHLEFHEHKKSGLGGLTGKDRSDTHNQITQIGSLVSGGKDVVLLTGTHLDIEGSTIAADRSVEMHTGLVNEAGSLTIEALQHQSLEESQTKKKSFGVDISSDFVSVGKERTRTQDGARHTNAASQILARQDITGNAAQDLVVVGSVLDAGNNLSLDAKRNILITSGSTAESVGKESQHRRDGIGLDVDKNGVTAFAGNEQRNNRDQLNQNTVAGSYLSAGGDLSVNAGNDLNIRGSDFTAGRNLHLDAVNNLDVNASHEQLDSEQRSEFTRDGLTLTANHNIGQAVDAIKAIGGGDNAVSDASSVMRAMDAINNVGPSASAHLGHTTTTDTQSLSQTTARGSTFSAGQDVIANAGNLANISGTRMTAARNIGVYGKDIRIDDEQNTQTANTTHDFLQAGLTLQATQGNASLTAGFSQAESDLEQVQVTTTGSTFTAGQDIDIHATHNLTAIGSDFTAARNINLQGDNDVALTAGQAYTRSRLDEEHQSGGAGINFGSDGIGVTAYAAAGENDLDRNNIHHRNSTVTAGERLTITSGNDATISGANLLAKDLNIDVGNNLYNQSRQDTGKVEGKRWDASGSITVGVGVSGGASVGYGETDGSRAWVSEQTTLVGLNSVTINVDNHTQVDGALIANIKEDGTDGGNLSLNTHTLGFGDLQDHDKEESNYLNIGFSTGGNSGANANTGASPDEENSSWSLQGNHYELDREQTTRATIGQGNITVREDQHTGVDSTSGLNRDIETAQEITKDKEREVDLYVSSTAIDSAQNLAATDNPNTTRDEGQDNTLVRWGDNVASVADADAYGQMLNNVKSLNDPEAIGAAWNELVGDVKESLGMPAPVIPAEEFEEKFRLPELTINPDGNQNPQQREPTVEDLVLLAAIKALRDEAVQEDGTSLYGWIDWDNVLTQAWDLDNGGPTAVLNALNDQVFDISMNKLTNISLLRQEVVNLNGVVTNFDNTVGMAANISTVGSAIYRVGAIIGEALSPATRQARELLDDARPLLGSGDDVADAGRDLGNAGEQIGSRNANSNFADADFYERLDQSGTRVIPNHSFTELQTSSGIVIKTTEGKTTTVLGTYMADTKNIIDDQLLHPKDPDFLSGRPNEFNILNVPDDLYKSPDQFWSEINEPFLRAAVERGDEIYLATRPTAGTLNRTLPDGTVQRSGFGREYDFLVKEGYVYDDVSGKMVKR